MLKLAAFVSVLICLIEVTCCNAQERHDFPVPPENTTCDSLKLYHDDLDSAIDMIGKTVFRFQQNISINRRRGFKEAAFFSCDNLSGYMLIKYHNCMLLYACVPKEIWEQMVTSSNPGDFYEINILETYVHLLSKGEIPNIKE